MINQGRKYVEAPRWAALGIVVIMVVFAYNVIGTAIAARKTTGIITVLMIDLVPLMLLYLIAFPAITNMSAELFWWWWLVQLWVEATWEVLIGCIMALALMQLLGTSRRIVEAVLADHHADGEILARDLGVPLRGVDGFELGVDVDLL